MFTLTEEQTLLQEAARGFVEDKMPVAHARAMRDARQTDGFDRALWAEMAGMGWTGVLVPEEFGGVGLGYRGLGLVLEQMGATLAPSPLASTALAAVSALVLSANQAARGAHLPRIAAGETIFALAVDDGDHHDPDHPRAELKNGHLSGVKRFVADGHCADQLIVSARSEQGAVLVVVPVSAEGVSVSPLATVDSRGAADIRFDGVAVGAEAILGEGALLTAVLDRVRIGAAAELFGLAEAAFKQTADYLQTRTQFGQAIGAFQGLQHRAAKLYVELELTRSCVHAALDALDQEAEPSKISELASLAKARAGDLAHVATNEMIQMHGGIGMTDAHDAGLYIKRARVLEHLYGSASFHRRRFAGLMGI
jgi:alkylation response protein AidB-like acyl-CoA dehydrogenase